MRSEGFYVNPLTSAGIEPATSRFVAQHLNHCATAVPTTIIVLTRLFVVFGTGAKRPDGKGGSNESQTRPH